MIPKKIFNPKCLHADRETVFREDLQNFYGFILAELRKKSNNELLICDESIFNYNSFKYYWKEKKMSMIHFSKSKEENLKEFYEVLYGEVQLFIFKDDLLYKAFCIFSLYSLYYTQISDYFYQINTIPEVLFEINNFIANIRNLNFKLMGEVLLMINKLYKDDALNIGTILGLKTIILNKYGLPIEQKQKVYKEYIDIDNTIQFLDKAKSIQKEKIKIFKNNFEDYKDIKKESIDLIKDIGNDNIFNELYCDFINSKLKEENSYFLPQKSINIFSVMSNNFDMLHLTKNDLVNDKITNLDLQFNRVDNHAFK